MAVHVIHWDELDSQEALTRTVPVEKFESIDLQNISDSLLPFGGKKFPPQHITRREKQKLLSANLLSEVLSIGDFRESTVRLKNVVVSVVRFTLPEIDFLVECQIPNQFPIFPPRIILVPPQGSKFELPIDWNYSTDELPEYQLARLIENALFSQVTALQTVRLADAISYGPVDSKNCSYFRSNTSSSTGLATNLLSEKGFSGYHR